MASTANQVKLREVETGLEKISNRLKMILPEHSSVEKMIMMVSNACFVNPDLLDIKYRKSLFLACLQAAKLGLEPNTSREECFLIPYKGIVKMQPGYKGIRKLVMNTGLVSTMEPRVVYENDDFDYDLGLNPKLTHKRALAGSRGSLKYVYCIVRPKDGSAPFFEVMDKDDITLIRKSSQSKAWGTNEAEMWIKTIIIRTGKRLEQSPELALALSLDGQAEAGKDQKFDADIYSILPEGEDIPTHEDKKLSRRTRSYSS